VLLAVVAWVLRALPLTGAGGSFGYPIDYDEGVYFSSSALFFQGHWPYRDFVFVHPPGSLWLWAPAGLVASWFGVDTGFTVARWLATLCGAGSTFLAGRLALRLWGPVAGVVAALVYATYPEATLRERGPYMEPLLNLACLAAANVWLASRGAKPRWLLAGALFGVAGSVKVLGGIWLFAALLSRPPWRSWKMHGGLLLAAAGTAVLLASPFLLRAAPEFFSQILLFHVRRPADGEVSCLSRLHEMFQKPRLMGAGLALLGLALVAARAFRTAGPTRPAERFLAVAYLLTITAFLTSATYWSQYNTYLAASESILAGLGGAAVYRSVRAWHPHLARCVVVLLAVTVVRPTWPWTREGLHLKAPEQVALGRCIRQAVPPDAPLFAFEPAWAIAGGRLPPIIPEAPLIVDSYALMLKGAMSSRQHFADALAAFQSPAAQQSIRELLARSRFVVLGGRGQWQLSEETRQWFHARFTRRFPPEGQGGLDLWEQIPHREDELTGGSGLGL
jgi:hypothetical protein